MCSNNSSEQEISRRKLITYLSSYRCACRQVTALSMRMATIEDDIGDPSMSIDYSGMPHSTTPGSGAAAAINRLADIDDRLEAERANAAACANCVLDMIDMLPQCTDMREILGYIYVDGFTVAQTCARMSYHSVCTYYSTLYKALDKLLAIDEVNNIVDDWINMYYPYFDVCGDKK